MVKKNCIKAQTTRCHSRRLLRFFFFSSRSIYGNSLLTNYNIIVTIKLSSVKSNILQHIVATQVFTSQHTTKLGKSFFFTLEYFPLLNNACLFVAYYVVLFVVNLRSSKVEKKIWLGLLYILLHTNIFWTYCHPREILVYVPTYIFQICMYHKVIGKYQSKN